AGAGERRIHIAPGTEELGRGWPTALSAVADVSLAALALSRLSLGRNWADQARAARADYEALSRPVAVTGAVNLSECTAHLADALPADPVAPTGARTPAARRHRVSRRRARRSQLAPTSGAMGYGFPAAIAAKLAAPQREVVCVAGDGDFLMTGQELATAVQHDARVVVIVVDNGTYGTIRMHQ